MNQPVKTAMLLVALTAFCFASAFAAKPSDKDTSQPKKLLVNPGVDGTAKPEVLEARVNPPATIKVDRLLVCSNFVYQGPTVVAAREGGSRLFGLCPRGYRCTDPPTGKCEWRFDNTGIVYGTPGRLSGNYTCPPSEDELRNCSLGITILSGGQ